MPSIEDELFPSTPGKFKIDRSNRQLHRCFASTSTMFLWALFLIALTASYLSFQSFEFGYKPTTDLETGLRKFVRWYLSYYGYNTKAKLVH
ncbi:hypothetical protein BRARA_A00699 [Brassica rapa]|uniref:Uncharacterized protein n=1 Tax=Brassica campestris TaxID=3711 RepID=A0A398AJ72_BRACM|nr:hypothetical protein BRARA_A00699 [Brassica rapa]